MLGLYSKILSTPRLIVPTAELANEPDVAVIGVKIQAKVATLFQGALSIREVAAGSTNAEEEEIKALSNAYYDVERFGIGFVASPRHADMLLVSGPVAVNMAEALRLTYEAMPEPRLVVAVGDGAINGGMWRGSYAVVDRVDQVIPVNYGIPGDPPSPRVILAALLQILELIDTSRP